MAKIIIIGGIESTFSNAQVLHSLGEDIVMFYTRGPDSPGWEGVEMIHAQQYPFYNKVPVTTVNTNINEYIDEMKALNPDFIYSLGWQQLYSRELLSICPVIGIHESLLPEGAGAVPIANAMLHDKAVTGVTLFWLDNGMDTGDIIAQLQGNLDPRQATATALYQEAIELEKYLLEMMVPHINANRAPHIPQNRQKRTTYGKIDWSRWPTDKVERTRTYPYT